MADENMNTVYNENSIRMTEKQKVKEITDRLEEGLIELFESEKYKSYLNTMSKFHNYSANNIQLISMQYPDATLVAGYKAWQRNFERHVKKGERGIRILAPAPYKIKEEREKTDSVSGEPMLDRDGMPVMEEVEVKIPAFRVVTVFDVAQTEGKELPDISVNELHGSVENYRDFMKALERVSPVSIGYEDMEGEKKGYFLDRQNRIAIQAGMSEVQTTKTGVHEVAHAMLHAKELHQGMDLSEHKDRETKEVEAESIAYTVCQHFGMDTSDYSFGYIAGWSSGKELPELKSSLNTIRKTSSELIRGIETQLLELLEERESEQTQENLMLLVENTDHSEYNLLNVRGMERNDLLSALLAMKDDDRQNVEAYLERAGAWVTLLGNEQSGENTINGMGEYHLDYAYNTDTHEITDVTYLQKIREKSLEPVHTSDVIVKVSGSMGSEYEIDRIVNMPAKQVEKILQDMAALDENEWDGNVQEYLEEHGAEIVPIIASNGFNDDYPHFYDFEYDFDSGEVSTVTELSAMKQAENLIHRLEFGKGELFRDDEKNLIVNYHYKLDDMEKTRELAETLAYRIENEPASKALTVRAAQAEMDALPDGMVGFGEMHEYGYSWDEMLPLTKERASELFEDVAVYQLHTDGSETLIEDGEKLQEHEGLFGVEKGDWSAYLEKQEMKQELEDSLPNREAQLLYGKESRYGIYQLKNTEETRDIRFMEMDYLERKGIPVSKEHYELVYTEELTEGMSLEDIYIKFNTDHPADFTGHSLSVSDVVVLHQDGENTSHYVDSIGYREIPEFIKEIAVSAEHTEEKTPVMGEAAEIAKEISQDEPDREHDRVSYYVIEDLSTWAENSTEKSRLERFDSLQEAIGQFLQYRAKETEYGDDKARATLGANVQGIEFDVVHVRGNENVLCLDFTHNSRVKESKRFMEDLQTLSIEIGFDKVRVHREMTAEETKDFVKQRLTYQLKNSGLSDISLYMDRFDSLYEQGKMEHLMPTVNQRQMVEDIPFTEWENPYMDTSDRKADMGETEFAFQLADRYISIQEVSDGYDYTIYDRNYRELDGGVYDNPNITIRQALNEIVTDLKEPMHRSELEGNIHTYDELIPIDYDELTEKAEQASKNQIEEHIRKKEEESRTVAAFKAKTEKMFHTIGGQTQEGIEQNVYAYLQSKMDEYEIDIELVDVAVSGSRCRGLEGEGSDLDVVVEYRGREREDDLFNAFNEDGFKIGGVKVDINPITEGKSGTLGTYLPGVEAYLEEKRAAMQEKNTEQAQEEKQTIVTLTVAECGEFHNLGEYHEGIAGVEEAVAIFNRIPPERRNGIPSIGIHIHVEGTERYEDVQMDIVSGNAADLKVLDYVPEITDNPKAVALIAELIDKLPDIEVVGSLEKWQTALLAVEIDQLSYDYDTYQYNDTVENREAQIANITEDIRNGNTGYLEDFLNAIASEGIREGITDIFGEGFEIDDSKGVQTARKAKELLDKLAEYKPLAKIEELEECNYNMIDNVLNNEKPKTEQESRTGRISVKEKLAEKKAATRQKDKAEKSIPEKETEKKSQREM